ncbi:beta-ketoacyl synthase N-terminal-like domain-containing protein [Micromonospora sp. CPCC 206061]|uniref:beta-ketoacyl synthase N-terminal-like domain-containing protein n=1 Tax=Micromonospora sp. CPCC 206061 TaxID=3122410 RepID=UPI002FF255A1
MSEAVITGIGVVSPVGVGVPAYWEATLAGRLGIDRISRFDPSGYTVKLAGEVRGFDAAGVPPRVRAQTDRMTHFALAAADDALADAGLTADDLAALPEYELAVVTADSSGGAEFGQRELEKLWREGPRSVGAFMSVAWFYAATTGQLSIRYGLRGACGVVATEQAGGLDALGSARRQLRRGGARLVLSGGTDASLSPAGLVAQMANQRMSGGTRPHDAYLPFDARARGYVPGEGGAILVVEDAEAARARGAPRVYARISGYAATFDPPPHTRRPPTLRRAIEFALADAGIEPGEVDAVFADAYGVPALDRHETEALSAVFGAHAVPVTAPKTMTGRLYAGAGALDTVSAVLAMRDSLIPPTVNVRPPDGHPLDLVLDQPRRAPVRCALVVARGYGGFNAAVVLHSVSTMEGATR